MDNFITVYQNLPCKIKGYVAYKPDEDYYTIVLNSRLSYIQNLQTFEHELLHIQHGDINSDMPVSLIEKYTNR